METTFSSMPPNQPPFDDLLYRPYEAFRSLTEREIPRKLVHYTTAKGFLGIIETRSVWASDLRFMNDSREIVHGLDIITSALKANLKNLSPGLRPLLGTSIQRILSDYTVPFPFAVSCSTRDDVLSQWRAYGGRAGYCVDLSRPAWSIRYENAGYVAPVLYRSDEQRALANQFAAEVERSFLHLELTTPMSATDEEIASSELMRMQINAVRLAALMKDSSFEEEREWRVMASLFGQWERIRFREAGPGIVPYVAFDLSEYDLLNLNVVVGPCPHPELARHAVIMRLGARPGTDPRMDAMVRNSTIPYRNW